MRHSETDGRDEGHLSDRDDMSALLARSEIGEHKHLDYDGSAQGQDRH